MGSCCYFGRHNIEHHAVIYIKKTLDRTPDLLRSDGQVVFEFGIEECGIVVIKSIFGQSLSAIHGGLSAEYALYDDEPTLFDSELEHYLAVTPEQIRSAVERFIDVDNRVVLDIVPPEVAAA